MKSTFKVALAIVVAFVSAAVGQQISGGGSGSGGTPCTTTALSVQYNNSGAFGCSSKFVVDVTNGVMTAGVPGTGKPSGGFGAQKNSFANNSAGFGLFNDTNDLNTGFYADQSANTNFLQNNNSHFQIKNGIGLIGLTDKIFGWGSASGDPPSYTVDTGLARNAAAVVEVNNGTPGTLGALKMATLTATTLATDATHTDNSVCVDTSTGLFYKGSGTVGICLGTSSARYKDVIKPLGNSLMQIAALSPKTFRYRKGYGDGGEKDQVGFLAEDVVKVVPKLVGLDQDGKPNSVDLVGMIPLLVKAMQEQQTVIECLRAKHPKC